VRGTRSGGRSTSVQNRPFSAIPRNSVTRTCPPPPGKYHPGDELWKSMPPVHQWAGLKSPVIHVRSNDADNVAALPSTLTVNGGLCKICSSSPSVQSALLLEYLEKVTWVNLTSLHVAVRISSLLYIYRCAENNPRRLTPRRLHPKL